MSALPETGFVRLRDIVNQPAKGDQPARTGIIPVSAATWWRGVGTRYPEPTRALGQNITAWAVEDIRQLVNEARGQAGAR